jgi:hypothetical protein
MVVKQDQEEETTSSLISRHWLDRAHGIGCISNQPKQKQRVGDGQSGDVGQNSKQAFYSINRVVVSQTRQTNRIEGKRREEKDGMAERRKGVF